MNAISTIPKVSDFPLAQLLEFRKNRPAWQMRLMNEFGDICEARLGSFRCVLLSTPEYAEAVLYDNPHHFVKSRGIEALKPLLGEGLLTSEHEFHRRQRKLIAPGFHSRRIAGFADVMTAYTEAAQAGWKDGEMIDISAAMMKLTLAIAGKTMFNADLEDEANEVGQAITIANRGAAEQVSTPLRLPLHWPTPSNRRVQSALKRLDETVYRMIAARRAAGTDPGDVLSMLLAAEEEGSGSRMSDTEVRDEAMTLFLAGHETTANALAWTFYLLSRHPEIAARLRSELDTVLAGRAPKIEDLPRLPYALQVFKEAMRLYPPAYIIGRQALREVTIGAHKLPKKMTALINIYGIHRRDKYFPNPEKFDPERFRPEAEKEMERCQYLPFGGGPRVCIGSQFALLEGHLVVAALAQRITFEAPNDRVVEPEPLITLRPKGGVPLIVRRRSKGRTETLRPPALNVASLGQG